MVRDADSAADGTALITRIALALGVPETVFLKGAAADTELEDTYELLQIWHRLDSPSDRRKLLTLARTLVTRR